MEWSFVLFGNNVEFAFKYRSQWLIQTLFVSLFLFSAPLWSAETRSEAISVVFSVDSVPFHFQNASGQPDGMVIDKWKLWSQKTGIKINFIPASWDDTILMVKNGEADAHAGLFYNEARDVFLDYGQPLAKSDTHVFYANSIPSPKSYRDFKAYRIGVLKGDAVEDWFKTYMGDLTLVGYPSYDKLMEALELGDVKIFSADTLTALYFLDKFNLSQQFKYKSNSPVYSNSFFLAVKQGNTGLLKTIMSGMNQIAEKESQAISRQWASGSRKKDSDTLIIAMDRGYPPLTLIGPDGEPSGLLVDMWRLWSKRTGYKIQFRPSGWGDSIEAVKNGDADIHSGLSETDDRAEWMAFSVPIHRSETSLYFHNSDPVLPIEALKGATVGVLAGSSQDIYLKDHFPDIETLYCTDGETLILNLLKKDVRAILHETIAVETALSRLGLSGSLKKSPETILSNSIHAGVSKHRKDLIPLINKGFSNIPYSEFASLELRWIPRKENRFYSTGTDSIMLTQDEKQFVASHKPLAFSETNWKPLSIVDRPKGFDGMIADYLDLITQRSGLRFEFQKSDTWNDVLQKYKDRIIDVIPALGKDDAIGREILFTNPFVHFPLVIVTRDDVSYIRNTTQLENLKVAVGRGYTSYQFLHHNYPAIELVETDDVAAGLMLLSNREVSAFVGHMAVVINAIQENGMTNLKIAGETEFVFDHRIGVDPRYPEAVSMINKVFETITETEHQAIYQKWLSVHYEKGIDYTLVIQILVGGFVFLILVLYWNRKLANEVSERKQTENRLLESEHKTRAMSEAIHDGLVMIDEKARVMYWNHAAENLFGIPSPEAMGKDMHSLFAPDEYHEKARNGLEVFARTGQGPVVGKLLELTALRRDKTRFPVEVGVSSFQMGDNWYAVGIIRDITERNQTQEIIQKTRAELQQIFDSAHVGIVFLKKERQIYRCNDRTAEILGYDSPAEMIDMNVSEIHLSRKSFETFGKSYYIKLAQGKQIRAEYELKRKDGTGIWCSLSGKAVDTATPPDMDQGVIWVIDDISDKRQALLALTESEERVKTILDSINTGILVINPEDRTIVDVNPVAARMIGLSREAITGRSCHTFICPQENQDCPIIDHFQAIDNAERILITADRREIPILKTVVPVMLGGKKHLLESFVDLTDRKEAEKEVQRNLEELQRFYKLTINREEKMIKLKEEVNRLMSQAGQRGKYTIR